MPFIRKLYEKAVALIKLDNEVYEHFKEREDRNLQIMALLCAVGFTIMSIVNIAVDADLMLWSTVIAAVDCTLGLVLSKALKSKYPVTIAIFLLLIFLFPTYTYYGGNDGFACMWIIIVAYLDLYFLGIKIGFITNFFYVAFLFLCFYGVLPGFHADKYTSVFLLRFPIFFFINAGFAFFFVSNIRVYQHDFIEKQQQLKEISILDMNTETYNRNGYIQWTENFDAEKISSLAYVYIDANGLHEINNSQGHEMGDKFLRSIADTCKSCFSNRDVYRLGGDEFLVICYDQSLDEVTSSIWQAKALLKKNGWNIAFGVEYRKGSYDLTEMLKTSNKYMLEDKAAFYSSVETDRRHSRI